jgi:uncharacterized membrane protein
MPNWLRALIAGYGAKKLGGGCFSTIIIFIVIWYVLGQCNNNQSSRNTYPSNVSTSEGKKSVAVNQGKQTIYLQAPKVR